MNKTDSAQKLQEFTKASLDWCAKEAESGTERVTDAIATLLKDIQRVSAMSSESLKALSSLQSVLSSIDKENYQELHKSLSTLSREHGEIDSYIQPIMEALQFQDRFRQNLENVVHMIDVWKDYRVRPDLTSRSSDDALKDFGEALIAKTTMKRERDVIREHIPGLEGEKDVSRVTLF